MVSNHPSLLHSTHYNILINLCDCCSFGRIKESWCYFLKEIIIKIYYLCNPQNSGWCFSQFQVDVKTVDHMFFLILNDKLLILICSIAYSCMLILRANSKNIDKILYFALRIQTKDEQKFSCFYYQLHCFI